MSGGAAVTPADAGVGARLRAARVLAGVGMAQLAAHLGVSAQQVHKYEVGRNRVPVAVLVAAAGLLGTSVGGLVGGAPVCATAPDPGLLELCATYARIADPRRRALLRTIARALAP